MQRFLLKPDFFISHLRRKKEEGRGKKEEGRRKSEVRFDRLNTLTMQ
ncbi:hypothetical protein [Okeania sp. KiyG1]|nr:hypothetical protein [Okeania sp. KiyG1]